MKIVKINHFNDAVKLFHKIGVDPYGIQAMVQKTIACNVLIPSLSCKIANILKQEMLSLGADAAVARGSIACSIDQTDVLLMGTHKQMTKLVEKISKQPFGLAKMSAELKELLKNLQQERFVFRTSQRQILLGAKTMIMGILNVTPDSFSDGNIYFDSQKAVDHGLKMAEDGADIIDIGGESTRPGSKTVTSKQEIARVIPVIEGLKKRVKTPLSVDTSKASVAKAALEAGAEIVNDVSALKDKRMIHVVKTSNAGLILMHMRGKPETMQSGDLEYKDLMAEIMDFLSDKCRKAVSGGVSRESIVLDPGIGFGKTYEDNCKIINNLSEMKAMGLPLLIGPSRKAFIGHVTGGKPEERLEGTSATVAAAIMNGCHIVRVHDVRYMRKVADMTDAIVKAG